MVAVYVADGDAVGASVGCVDDVDEGLEARITFETAVDASYFVQTGGFGGSTGDLSVLVLRVAHHDLRRWRYSLRRRASLSIGPAQSAS